MNSNFNRRVAKMSAFLTIAVFLGMHILMLVFFICYKITPLVYLNLASVLLYFACFALIATNRIRACVYACFAGVNIYMFLTTLCLGWGYGFQITLFGLVILVCYSDYFARKLGDGLRHGVVLGILTMCVYLGSFVISYFGTPYYELPKIVGFWSNIVWSILLFGIAILYLTMLIRFSFQDEKKLSERAMKDELTGLANRYAMMENINRKMSSGEYDRFWIAMMDIDDFKKINDTYGHNCGDYVLREMAQMIYDNVTEEMFCRWGGEEFLMFKELEDRMQDVCVKLNYLRKQVESHEFVYDGQHIHITITIGAAEYRKGETLEEWIEHADRNLYVGKYNGKNRVVC